MLMNWTQEAYIKGYHFAAKAHNQQKFPGTDLPYMVHISLVTMEVIAALRGSPGLDGDLAVQCALLHDVIEDTNIDYTLVESTFGGKVADGVIALSKNDGLDNAVQMQDSLYRIKLQPAEIWLVKLADRITNLSKPPMHWTAEKIFGYREEAVEIVQE
ncbi:MAG: HD domain-containing protein, partial [Chloroflexota bacterium]